MFPFEAGCTHILVGQSGSGKTRFIKKLSENKNYMFEENIPLKIRYHYGIWQDLFNELLDTIPGISFHEGLPLEDDLLSFTNPKTHTILILDDIMHLASNSQVIELIFTRISHHRNCSCFYLVQNAFIKGKNQVTIAMNTKYIEFLRPPRSLMQLQYLNSQIFPNNKGLLIKAYTDIMSIHDFGYLIIDLTTHCLDKLRVRSQIFPGEQTVIFQSCACHGRERTSNQSNWFVLNRYFPKSQITFFSQIVIIYIIIITAVVNLSIENGDKTLRCTLLDSCLGYILPAPSIKTIKHQNIGV